MLKKAAAVPDVELVIRTDSHAACFFERLCEPGRSVVIIGIHSPALPARWLELAFDALASGKVDVVFGPAINGGCYLIGMNSYHAELFRDMEWDSPDVLKRCIERAAELGLGWFLLPEWREVECSTDVETLAGEVYRWQETSA